MQHTDYTDRARERWTGRKGGEEEDFGEETEQQWNIYSYTGGLIISI